MSAIAIQAMLSAAPPAAGANANPDAAPDAGFSALLGKMADPKASATPTRSEPTKSKNAAADEEAAMSAQSALQSLEAALTGFVAPAAANPPAATAQAGAAAKQNSAPLNSALAAAAGALENNAGGLWDGSGRAPLKALLQSDPSLGLTDFQMKTFLAAAGATPMRAAGTPLGPGSAWSPLAVAATTEASRSPETAPAPIAETLANQPATLAALASSLNGAAGLPARGLSSANNPNNGAHGVATNVSGGKSSAARPLVARASGDEASPAPPNTASDGASALDEPFSGGARRGGALATTSDAAAPASAAFASADAASTPTFTVPLANLPTFIAEQASALASASAPDAPGSAATATSAPAKAAQAVKELNIALDPADLGAMTLKLRLAGGKFSITIGVVNSQTLAAIEDDRALIAARLATGGQGLEDLVIQRQSAASPTPDTGQAHGFANDGDTQSSSSQGEPEAQNRGSHAAARRGSGVDGSFGDLIV